MRRDYSLFIRLVYFFGGIYLIAFGKIFLIASNLGVDPWTVFHMGIANYLPFTVGQVSQGVGVIMILISWALKIKPNIGTFLNMYFFGYFLDLNIALNDAVKIASPTQNMAVAILYMLLGTVISGIGLGIYINGELGAGPRDSFMLGMSKLTGKKPGLINILMEIGVLLVGWILGGPVGLGTLVYALGLGPVMQWTLDHVKLPQKKKSHEAAVSHD